MQNDVRPAKTGGRWQGDIPVGVRERDGLVGDEFLRKRATELAACAGDQVHAARSRGDRIGSCVLHRCFTRGSAQQSPCSSGFSGSYSSVTW